jgi:hypothetical protein
MLETNGFVILFSGDHSVGIQSSYFFLNGSFCFEDQGEMDAFTEDLASLFEGHQTDWKPDVVTIEEWDRMIHQEEVASGHEGLHHKYIVSRSDGKPIDPGNRYFVLKIAGKGDEKHLKASKKAVLTYAEEIKDSLPELASDLFKMFGRK